MVTPDTPVRFFNFAQSKRNENNRTLVRFFSETKGFLFGTKLCWIKSLLYAHVGIYRQESILSASDPVGDIEHTHTHTENVLYRLHHNIGRCD